MDVEEKEEDDDDDDEEEEEEDDDVEEEDRSPDREAHLVRACAVEMHMDISQEPCCMEFYTGTAFGALRRRNARGHLKRTILFAMLSGNLQEKCRTPIPRTSFCASAVQMHTDASQEPCCVEIYREDAGRV